MRILLVWLMLTASAHADVGAARVAGGPCWLLNPQLIVERHAQADISSLEVKNDQDNLLGQRSTFLKPTPEKYASLTIQDTKNTLTQSRPRFVIRANPHELMVAEQHPLFTPAAAPRTAGNGHSSSGQTKGAL